LFDYVVVGSGLAGSVIAERIGKSLNKKVLVVEKRNHIGGNCYDFRTREGIIVHKYGPHLFHTNHKEVFDYLSNFTDWHEYQHKVLVFVDGMKVPIPFNLNTLYMVFPNALARRIEKKLLLRFSYNSKVPILRLKEENDEDLKFLAEYIYEKIFVNYTIKQWGIRPEEIDSRVTARVPVFIGKDSRYFDDKYQAVPCEGYTKVFERILSHPNIKLMLNTDFKEIVKVDLETRKIFLFGQEFKGKVVFTGMIDELFEYKFGKLAYRSLDLRFETLEVEYFQEVATVNYPNDYDFTRITEFKHIHPTEVDKTVILKEYPKACKLGRDIPYYPILTKENKEKYFRYREIANEFDNLILVGRLADYCYYNMDDVVKKALEIFEEKIK